MAKGNKGGRRGWTTPEQDKWLRRYKPLYHTSQDRGVHGLADFWPQLFEVLFARWPKPTTDAGALSTAIKAKKKVSIGLRLVALEAYYLYLHLSCLAHQGMV
jgi:hypothetical protein